MRNIPLDQLLAGPRRTKLAFDKEPGEIRGTGMMLRNEGAPPVSCGAGALLRGAGPKKGWGSVTAGSHVAFRTAAGAPKRKELTVARVIKNENARIVC